MILRSGMTTFKSFMFAIAASVSDVNLRTAALAAGWNGSAAVQAIVNPGVALTGSSTASYGLTVNGSFPGGIALVVSEGATLAGRGGVGGAGGVGSTGAGTNGTGGGTALLVSVPISIHNFGTIAGGGGGGGGGAGYTFNNGIDHSGVFTYYGQADSPGNGGNGARFGVAATLGEGALNYEAYNSNYGGSGNGGVMGTAGSRADSSLSGGGSVGYNYGYGLGGAAGNAVTGNEFITWLFPGTRLGPIA